MGLPKFDPNAKFEKVASNVRFDPGADFEKVEEPGMIESTLRGTAQGATFDLADEGTAALESMFTDKKYEEALAESRKAYKAAEDAHPALYTAGNVGGSLATAMIPGLGALNVGKGAHLAEVAGKAALQGGLSGFGRSEKEGLDLAKDTATGALIGGALGTAAHGIGKGIEKASEAYDNIGGREGLKQVAKAFREGAKDGREIGGIDIGNVPIVSQVSQGISGAKRAISEAAEMAKGRKEFAGTAEALQKTFGPGSATDLSSNDVLMMKLLDEGIAGEPNAAHQLVASKFASVHGGSPEQYLDLIKRSPDELSDAMQFDKVSASEELAPKLDSAFNEVRKASGKRYEGLKGAAREQFSQQDTSPVRVVSEAIRDASSRKSISGQTRNTLDDIFSDITGREGEKSWTQLNPQEQFDRILDAKQRLGKVVKWAQKNELPEGQQILADTYGKFQKMLQGLDQMAAADKGYAGFKDIENNLFKPMATVERGRIKEFDPIKMEKLFTSTESGRRMMKQVEKARAMLESGALPPESAGKVKAFLDQLDDMAQKSSLKRGLNNFRYGDAGPSGPAIQRMSAIAGGDSATTTAVRAPQMFLKIKANASAASKSIFGKRFNELSQPEKRVISQYALWASKNEGATDVAIKRKIADLIGQMK